MSEDVEEMNVQSGEQTMDNDQNKSLPSVQVSLLGSFRFEWLVPGRAEIDAWLSRTSARSLFKLLLCAPDRQATRSQLAGTLWPETDEERARESLRSAIKVLRSVLYPQHGDNLLQSLPGEVLKLRGQEILWVDADAFEVLVRQASHARDPQEALSYWEQARVLMRGEFLVEEQNSEWINHRWVKVRRQTLRATRRQMVRSLADLYIQFGQEKQAEELLYDHVTRFPIDQDALYRLMKLLIHAECFDEARSYYEQSKATLATLGKQPADHLKALEKYLMTQSHNVVEGWRTKQREREQPVTDIISTIKHAQFLASSQNEFPTSPSLTNIFFLENIEHMHEKQKLFPEIRDFESINTIAGIKPSFHQMSPGMDTVQTRRQILHRLLMIGSTALVLSPHAVLPHQENKQQNLSELEDLEMITASYWRFCAGASFDLLGTLSEHFRIVIYHLQQALSPTTAQRLYSLSGEVAQLLGQTLFDVREYSLAWSYYQFSLKAAQTASNHDLWATGIGRMILLLMSWKTPQKALPLLQEMHQLTVHNNRIACWLAAIEAEIYAMLGDAASCEKALTMAKNIFKNETLEEDRYATRFNVSRLAGYEGACFVQLRQPDRALPALQQAMALLDDPQALRRQSRLLTDMSAAYAQQGNLQQAWQLASQALVITVRTKSRAVLERVRTVRQELEPWKETNQVKELEHQLDTTATLILV